MATKPTIEQVVIEIPKGSSNKYEVDVTTNNIVLDRVLYGANFYPGEYGFIDETLDWDGDPLDVIALSTYPTFPGCRVNVKILGTVNMIDDGEVDTKLFGVFADDIRWNGFNSLEEVPVAYRNEIEEFFKQYKTLQHKSTEIRGWGDEAQAAKELQECKDRFQQYKDRIAKPGEKDKIVEEWHKKGLGLG